MGAALNARVATREAAARHKLEVSWAAAVAGHARLLAYLEHRGLRTADVPAALRLSEREAYWDSGTDGQAVDLGNFAAMLARVETLDGELVALHRTYLDPARPGKLEAIDGQPVKPKKLTHAIREGATRGAAIHLDEAEGDTLALAEGIETGLAVRQALGVPVWACVSAGGLAAVELPAHVKRVEIWADHDRPQRDGSPGAGQRAAEELAERLVREGREVRIILPEREADDWRDVHERKGEAALVDAAVRAQAWTPGEPWEPLVPLARARALPEFPLDALSAWLRDMASATARAYQVPCELPTLYALALVSGAVAGKYVVQVRPGWRMPPTLYVLVALPPSERKSPVIHALAAPLREYERQRAEAIAQKRTDALACVKQARAAEEAALRRLAHPGKDDKADGLAGAHSAAARKVAEAEAAVPPEARMIVEYATPEALAERMAAWDDRQIIVSDEGAGVLAMTGRYARWGGADLDLLLRGYDGLPYTPARITRQVRPLHAATLAIALGAQPAAIVEMLRCAPEIRERGLLARFLALLPAAMVGRREIRPEPVPQRIAEEYARRMGALLVIKDEHRDGRLAPRELRLSRAADDVIAAFEAELEPAMRRGGRYERIAAWAGKLAGQAARIAALLHLADHAGETVPGEIAAETAERAVRLARACIPHTETFEDLLGAPPELDGARRIAGWLRRQGRLVVTDREILRGTRGAVTLATAEQRDAALRLLAGHGYVRRAAPDTSGGRRPSGRWQVHPEWLSSESGVRESLDEMDEIPPPGSDEPDHADIVHLVQGLVDSADAACAAREGDL